MVRQVIEKTPVDIKFYFCCFWCWNSTGECQMSDSRAARIANFLCRQPTIVGSKLAYFPQKKFPCKNQNVIYVNPGTFEFTNVPQLAKNQSRWVCGFLSFWSWSLRIKKGNLHLLKINISHYSHFIKIIKGHETSFHLSQKSSKQVGNNFISSSNISPNFVLILSRILTNRLGAIILLKIVF